MSGVDGAYEGKDGKRITVRKATRRDVAPAAELWQSLADERRYIATERVSREQRARWAKWVDDGGILWAMAEMDGRLVGSLSLARLGDLEKTKHVRALGMGVRKGFRGAGVGTALMDYALRWAREKRVKKVVLSVFSTNKEAIRLYEKFGFVSEGVRRKQFVIEGGYVDEIMMARFP